MLLQVIIMQPLRMIPLNISKYTYWHEIFRHLAEWLHNKSPNIHLNVHSTVNAHFWSIVSSGFHNVIRWNKFYESLLPTSSTKISFFWTYMHVSTKNVLCKPSMSPRKCQTRHCLDWCVSLPVPDATPTLSLTLTSNRMLYNCIFKLCT